MVDPIGRIERQEGLKKQNNGLISRKSLGGDSQAPLFWQGFNGFLHSERSSDRFWFAVLFLQNVSSQK